MKALIGLGLGLLGFMNGCNDQDTTKGKEEKQYRLDGSAKMKLLEGDLLFRSGSGLVSSMISAMQKTPYDISHCGILIGRESGYQVVSAISSEISNKEGVHSVALDTFVANSKPESLIVLRLVNQGPEARKKMAGQAWQYAQERKPFDHGFSLEEDERFYCTELIYKVIKQKISPSVGIAPKQTKGGKNYIGFKAFFDSKHFTTVLNHQTS